MKKLTFLFVTAITMLLSTVANSQTPNPLYQHLPPTADHIYSVRLGQIITKGDLTGLLTTIPVKDPTTAKFLSALTDPASAGVDLDHEILVAQTTASGTGSDTLSFTQFLVPLTDSAKLRSTFMTGQHIHRVAGKGNTMSTSKEGDAWDDHLWVMTVVSVESHDPGSKSAHKPAAAIHRPLSELAIEKSLAALAGFSGTPWLTDQRFLTGFATNEDMHGWSQKMDFMGIMSKLMKKMAAKNPALQNSPFPAYNNLNSQVPRPPVLSTFNFENGRIIFRLTTFTKPEDGALIKRVYDRPINKDLLARVPAGPLLGFFAVHLNPAAIPDLLDKYHTRQMIDSMLAKRGLNINDISGAIGGDFLFAALGDTTATTDTSKNKFDFYFAATLGDPSKLMQLSAKVMANATDTAKAAKMKKLADKMVIRDNMVVISNSKGMAQKYLDNSDRRSTSLLGDADKSSMAIVVDLKAVSTFITATQSGNPKSMVIARVLEKLDKIEISSRLSDDNYTVGTFQIVTGDPSTNSLKTLVSLLH
jgi:hypothetical protein